jgi:hypothetical protein
MTQYIAGHPVVDGIVPPGCGTGYVSRDYQSYPHGGLAFASSATPIKELTDAEILEAIADKTAHKTWITDLCDQIGSGVKNQQNSNYCWGHAATRACEICYVMSGGQHVPLAAFDICALIKGGWNQGGSGIEAIERIARDGVCTEALHRPMDFSPHRSAEQEANAQLHKIEAYDDIDVNAHRLIASYVIANIGVSVGIPAWSHEVCITYLVAEGGQWYFGIDNSWGPDNFGVKGRGVLHGAYSRFDEAGAVRLMTPSEI